MTLDNLITQAKAASQKRPADTIKIRITYNGESYLLQFRNGQQVSELEKTQ